MNVSKIVLAAALAGSVTVMAGCSSPQVVNDPDGAGLSQTQKVTAYQNSTEGYTLKYPTAWQSNVAPEDTLDWDSQQLNAENVVVFNYTPSNGKPEALLALAVYPQDQLSQLQQKPGTTLYSAPQVIATNGDKVLVAYLRGTNPYSLTSSDGQAFSARALNTQQIKDAINWQ